MPTAIDVNKDKHNSPPERRIVEVSESGDVRHPINSCKLCFSTEFAGIDWMANISTFKYLEGTKCPNQRSSPRLASVTSNYLGMKISMVVASIVLAAITLPG